MGSTCLRKNKLFSSNPNLSRLSLCLIHYYGKYIKFQGNILELRIPSTNYPKTNQKAQLELINRPLYRIYTSRLTVGYEGEAVGLGLEVVGTEAKQELSKDEKGRSRIAGTELRPEAG